MDVSTRITHGLLLLVLLALLSIVSMLATGVRGGSLDPAGTPAPTLRPLDEIRSAWKYQLSSDDGEDSCASSRFTCVFENLAVFDRETGLVWERFVYAEPDLFEFARSGCISSQIAGRYGWRLPTSAELTSLIDRSTTEPPLLPPGHPFDGIHPTDVYWTGTIGINRSNGNPTRDLVSFEAALGSAVPFSAVTGRRWCVRGGGGEGG